MHRLHTHTHILSFSEYVKLTAFPRQHCFTKASQCYIIHTLPVLVVPGVSVNTHNYSCICWDFDHNEWLLPVEREFFSLLHCYLCWYFHQELLLDIKFSLISISLDTSSTHSWTVSDNKDMSLILISFFPKFLKQLNASAQSAKVFFRNCPSVKCFTSLALHVDATERKIICNLSFTTQSLVIKFVSVLHCSAIFPAIFRYYT